MTTQRPRRKRPDDEKLREHEYDGIQEFDKRLPNWWLFTLYGAIIFSFGYWFYNHSAGVRDTSIDNLESELRRIAEAKAASQPLTDEALWQMSMDTGITAAGRQVFATTCASCHGENAEGKIGPSLTDNTWIHGGSPVEIATVVKGGVLEKGMPAWEPVLGHKRVTEVTAYILSLHKPPEPPAN